MRLSLIEFAKLGAPRPLEPWQISVLELLEANLDDPRQLVSSYVSLACVCF